VSDFREFLEKQLQDPEFKREWDAFEPEFSAVKAMIHVNQISASTPQPRHCEGAVPEAIQDLHSGLLRASQ